MGGEVFDLKPSRVCEVYNLCEMTTKKTKEMTCERVYRVWTVEYTSYFIQVTQIGAHAYGHAAPPTAHGARPHKPTCHDATVSTSYRRTFEAEEACAHTP